jgi:hypothetical protein
MNKALYIFCQAKFRTLHKGKLKLSSLLSRLNDDYGFGLIDGNYLYFTEKDRASLIERVQLENCLHLFRDLYPEAQSRALTAKVQRNEKTNSYTVSQDFVLLNSLQTMQLNKQQFQGNPFTSLGMYLKADEIISVEHPQIVLVENLTIMANLHALVIPASLRSALWLYRGDFKKQQQTSCAYQFFRRFRETNQLICFSDLDPAGIQIALTCDAHYWLTPQDSGVINMALQGEENEWFNQQSAIRYLQDRPALPKKCQDALAQMMLSRKTLKQEQMLAHHIQLALFKL